MKMKMFHKLIKMVEKTKIRKTKKMIHNKANKLVKIIMLKKVVYNKANKLIINKIKEEMINHIVKIDLPKK